MAFGHLRLKAEDGKGCWKILTRACIKGTILIFAWCDCGKNVENRKMISRRESDPHLLNAMRIFFSFLYNV